MKMTMKEFLLSKVANTVSATTIEQGLSIDFITEEEKSAWICCF